MDLISYAASRKYTDKEVSRIVDRVTDSDAMSRQAAVNANGVDKVNLKNRLDEDYNKVNEKLSDVTTQLAEKAQKGHIAVSDIDKTLGKFDQTYMSEEFLQQIAGTAPINSVPAVGSLVPNQFAFPVIQGRKSKNSINLSTIIKGRYINSATGVSTVNATYSHTDFEEIYPSTDFTLSVRENLGLPQLAFYDENKVYISGITNSGISLKTTFKTPSNAKYIRVSLHNERLNLYQLEVGTEMTAYEVGGGIWIPVSELEKGKLTPEYFDESINQKLNEKSGTNIITVKADGTGDFTSLRSAVASITGASESNQYEIQIHEGIYDIFSDYTIAEIDATSFIGLQLTNYIHLKGIGDKKKIVLKGEIADTFSTATKVRVSTIVTRNNVDLENVTITAKNLRYAVHDDYNYANLKRHVKNCDFIHYDSIGNNQAYGQGSWSGTEHIFEDCYFYTEKPGYAYSFHNNRNFTRPSKNVFINCKFESPNSEYSVKFGSMGSGQKDIVQLVGCRIDGKLRVKEEQDGSGVGIDFEIIGYGNDVVPVEITHADGKQYTYNFVGESIEAKNVSLGTITKGTPVKMKPDITGVEPMTTNDSPLLLYGITFEDIAPNETGVVRIGGYLRISDTPLTGLVVGDKVGIADGVLVKATTGDYVGVVTLTDYIKLKF